MRFEEASLPGGISRRCAEVDRYLHLALTAVFALLCILLLSSAVLPSPGESDGAWSPANKRQVYQGEELYTYIDGGAEVYLKAGFKKLTVENFTSKHYSDPIVVEIYEMADGIGARQVYEKHRIHKAAAVQLGDEGSYYPGILAFWRGHCYCRVYTYNKLRKDRETLLIIGTGALSSLQAPERR
jgi:hypothetical protein